MGNRIRNHKSWVTSHTECPNCNYKFNFRHSKWGSASAVRFGPNWTFICPNCKTKQSFLLKKGEESGLSLIMDQSLSPFLAGAVFGLVGFFYCNDSTLLWNLWKHKFWCVHLRVHNFTDCLCSVYDLSRNCFQIFRKILHNGSAPWMSTINFRMLCTHN